MKDLFPEILVAVVLYNCKLSDCQSFLAIRKQCQSSHVDIGYYIHDNSCVPDEEAVLLAAGDSSLTYVFNGSNSGLSLAYNKAAEWGKQHHFKWILLMDQDTILPDNFIVAYLDAIRKHTDVCLFAPQVILLNDRPFSPSLRRGKACCLPEGFYPLQRYNTINSGRLINIEAFLNVRGYDEKIWLDFADYQFADRLKAVCGQFYMIPVVCRQPFSNHETDKQKLLRRFRIYVDCANHCKWDSFRDRIDHVYRVIRHAAGLICRTKDLKFLYILVVHFKIGRFLV